MTWMLVSTPSPLLQTHFANPLLPLVLRDPHLQFHHPVLTAGTSPHPPLRPQPDRSVASPADSLAALAVRNHPPCHALSWIHLRTANSANPLRHHQVCRTRLATDRALLGHSRGVSRVNRVRAGPTVRLRRMLVQGRLWVIRVTVGSVCSLCLNRVVVERVLRGYGVNWINVRHGDKAQASSIQSPLISYITALIEFGDSFPPFTSWYSYFPSYI